MPNHQSRHCDFWGSLTFNTIEPRISFITENPLARILPLCLVKALLFDVTDHTGSYCQASHGRAYGKNSH